MANLGKVKVECDIDIENAVIETLLEEMKELQRNFDVLEGRLDKITRHHGMISGREDQFDYGSSC